MGGRRQVQQRRILVELPDPFPIGPEPGGEGAEDDRRLASQEEDWKGGEDLLRRRHREVPLRGLLRGRHLDRAPGPKSAWCREGCPSPPAPPGGPGPLFGAAGGRPERRCRGWASEIGHHQSRGPELNRSPRPHDVGFSRLHPRNSLPCRAVTTLSFAQKSRLTSYTESPLVISHVRADRL